MSKELTEYEVFKQSSPENRRLLRQEELILEVTELLSETLEKEGVSRVELAQRLGKTKGFVSQILAGGRNLTLRTIADVADALVCNVHLSLLKDTNSERIPKKDKWQALPHQDLFRERPKIWQPSSPILLLTPDIVADQGAAREALLEELDLAA
jgi:transcriptional regulator with XRE-family HTH domain